LYRDIKFHVSANVNFCKDNKKKGGGELVLVVILCCVFVVSRNAVTYTYSDCKNAKQKVNITLIMRNPELKTSEKK
jgi:hypothetical protein